MKKRSFFINTIIGLALTVTAVSAIRQEPFTDVPQNHWAYNAIEEGRKSGLWEGYPDGTFKPNASITRAEMAVLISRHNKMVTDKITALENKVNEQGEEMYFGDWNILVAEIL